MTNESANPNRRAVMGNAFRDCDFCGRSRPTADGKDRNWQYRENGVWIDGVFCSKVCLKSHRNVNGR